MKTKQSFKELADAHLKSIGYYCKNGAYIKDGHHFLVLKGRKDFELFRGYPAQTAAMLYTGTATFPLMATDILKGRKVL